MVKRVKTVRVTLITTGGTIDGADLDTESRRSVSALQTYLEADPDFHVTVFALCNKDSREITLSDRAQLLRIIEEAPDDRVLIGHGTFTICETGRFLKSGLVNSRLRVLLVGAWIPFGDQGSDAPEQARFALDSLKSDQPGVFIAMDERLWDPNTTEKRETFPGSWALVETE